MCWAGPHGKASTAANPPRVPKCWRPARHFYPCWSCSWDTGAKLPTREVPPVSPCFPPRAQRFQSVILCFPPTAHPQHLSLCSKLIRLSPKIKSSPAVCCAVKMRGCEPHHAPLSLKRQQKSRRRRYGFCEHHCGSCLTPETPSPEQGEGRKTTPALSPPISFPPCCPSMPCQCQPAPAQDCPSTGLPTGQSTACDAEQHLLLVSLYIPT